MIFSIDSIKKLCFFMQIQLIIIVNIDVTTAIITLSQKVKLGQTVPWQIKLNNNNIILRIILMLKLLCLIVRKKVELGQTVPSNKLIILLLLLIN